MNIPAKFNQGDTFTLTDQTSTYLGSALAAGEWNLVLSFRGPAALDLTAPFASGGFSFAIDKTQAAKFLPGRYRWVARLQHSDAPARPQYLSFTGDVTNGSNYVNNCTGDIDQIMVGDIVQNSNFQGLGDVTVVSVDHFDTYANISLSVNASSPGDVYNEGFQVTTVTAPLGPNDGQLTTIEEGTVDVLPDITQFSAGYDARTQSEIDLEAVQKAMRQMISGGAVQEYQIGNRSVKKMSMDALITLESKLKYQIARERRAKSIAAGLGDPSNVFVRFTR